MKLLTLILLATLSFNSYAGHDDVKMQQMMMAVVKAKLEPGQTYKCTNMYCVIYERDPTYKIGCVK